MKAAAALLDFFMLNIIKSTVWPVQDGNTIPFPYTCCVLDPSTDDVENAGPDSPLNHDACIRNMNDDYYWNTVS